MEEIEDANKDAIRSCHRLLNLLSHHQDRVHCESLVAETDEAVFKFRKVISMLSNNLNGEMRVKQKSQPSCPQKSLDYSHTESDQFVYRNTPQTLTSTLETSMKNSVQVLSKYTNGNPPMENDSSCKTFLQLMSQEPINQLKITQPKVEQTTSLIQMKFQSDTISEGSNSGINIKFDGYPYSSMSTISSKRSLTSSLSIDGSMSNQDSNGFHLISAAQVSDQNTQSCKKRCLGLEHGKEKCVTRGKCHCSKKRKLRIKRSIKVPSISNKIADIPPDDYSWRKYGQKPIKGSPYPRGYYKCSTMRGCAARKHVERCLDEPSMLMVTYEGEHNHSTLTSDSPKQQGMTDMNESVVQRDYPLAEYRL